MKTWVLTTHYDCEVYTSLHSSMEDCYQKLNADWLDECNDEYGCEHDLGTTSGIADALEYHYDAMDYTMQELEVPGQITVERPAKNAIGTSDPSSWPTPDDDLLTKLQTFQEGS